MGNSARSSGGAWYLMSDQRLINSLVDRSTVRDLDFHGRRITNAAPSVGADDYVVQQELTDAVNKLLVGYTGVLNFPGGFTVKGITFNYIEFSAGKLVGVS